MKPKVWLILAAALLFSVACSLTSLGSSPQAPTPIPSVAVLFQDDFADPNSGWDRVQTEDGITDYTNDGAYRIQVNIPNTDIWANPGLDFTDVRIEVDATKVGGPDDNDFGVQCRYQDIDNFYFFIISSDGYYAIGKLKDGKETLLTGDVMDYSDAILQGFATNHLRADCVGNILSLYVNGAPLASVQDSDFRHGDVGLMAGTFDTPGTEILFDHFAVLRP